MRRQHNIANQTYHILSRSTGAILPALKPLVDGGEAVLK